MLSTVFESGRAVLSMQQKVSNVPNVFLSPESDLECSETALSMLSHHLLLVFTRQFIYIGMLTAGLNTAKNQSDSKYSCYELFKHV